MKRRQKVTLLVLGLFVLIVASVLGVYVWSHSRSAATPEHFLSPCPQIVLGEIPATLSPAIAWEPEQLHITLTALYGAPTPPVSSAQLLWTALDGLGRATRTGCVVPRQVTLVVHAHGTQENVGHVTILQGEDVAGWAQGALAPEQLAARAAYRQIQNSPSTALPCLP
ncbi:MAG: hypothetical protein U9R05_07255 [Chloroflexota bacterium]|nr:hypothetical protein [Chloroflexota bacterium]